MTPSARAVLGDDERVCRPRGAIPSTIVSSSSGTDAALLLDPARAPSRPRPCGSTRPSKSTPLIRVCAVNGTSRASGELALAQAVVLLREHDDRAALRRLVGEAREQRGVGEVALARRRAAGGTPPPAGCRSVIVPVLSSSSVEQSPAASTARPRHGEHVALHEPVHAGDADRREQRADRRRDQAHEQRDQHDQRLLRPRVDRERLQRHDREQEDDREPREQDVERDLVRRLLAARRPRRARSCGRGTSRPAST